MWNNCEIIDCRLLLTNSVKRNSSFSEVDSKGHFKMHEQDQTNKELKLHS